jgi:dipeptidyl aminopeptidase/acylaminoacyl peptidase
MRAFLAVAAIAAAMSFTASADDFTADTSLADNDRVVRSVTLEDLKAIAVSEGHEITEVGGQGDVSLRALTPDGLIFHLIGTACDTEYADGCLGLMVQVRYDSDEDVTTEAINNANITYAAVSTWWDKEGKTVGVTRYIILDGGQRMENLKVNLQNALSLGPMVADVVWPVDMSDEDLDAYYEWLNSGDDDQ